MKNNSKKKKAIRRMKGGKVIGTMCCKMNEELKPLEGQNRKDTFETKVTKSEARHNVYRQDMFILRRSWAPLRAKQGLSQL